MHSSRFACLLFWVLSVAIASGQDTASPPPVKEAELGKTRNVHACGRLFLAGQPTEADIALIKQRGVKRVITLRRDGEVDWDEAKAVRDAGLEFIQIPMGAPDTVGDEQFARIRQLLGESGEKPTCCIAVPRPGSAVWLAYRVLDQNVALDQAAEEARRIGLLSKAYEERAKAYIAKQSQESSVRPGINKGFLDPKMKVDEWVARFEGESREIYRQRNEILDALKLSRDSRVADIGAGTGFFAAAMARRASKGWVYAVDISPRLVQHVGDVAAKAKLNNLTPVLCAEDAIRLPPNSVDVVFICDTYHHFEYPKSTLASIFRSLKPSGTLIVIDFEKIPGKTRPFIMSHVRADKATFRNEIVSAGFEFDREIDIEGLKENYVLQFRKPHR